MSKSSKKINAFIVLVAIVFMATFMCTLITTSASAYKVNFDTKSVVIGNYDTTERIDVAEKHDMELKNFARITSIVNSSNLYCSLNGIEEQYEVNVVKVILTREASINKVNTEKFLQIFNIKAVIGADRIVTNEDIANERFRRILTLELEVAGASQVIEAISALEILDEVLLAEPAYIFEGGDDWAPPNDPLYNGGTNRNQWGLRGPNGIYAEQAWTIARGDTNPRIRIGIFETGIQTNHPDLRVVNGNFTPVTGAILDHGTAVGGVIGAITHNSLGVAGIAQVEISLLNRNNFQSSLEWARDQGIQIVNASFWQSRPTVNTAGVVTANAIPSATNMAAIANFPGLFITSAGNQGLNNDIYPQYPAAYNLPNLITVGSIDINGERSSFSNWGKWTVELFAPGDDILTTFPEDRWGANISGYTQVTQGYARSYGTSFSAPMVAGVAALILSHFSEYNLDGAAVKNIIMDSVDTSSALENLCVSGGRLNAYKALSITNPVSYLIHNRGTNATVSGDFDGDNYEDALMLLHIGDRVEIHSWLGGSLGLVYDGLWWVGEANIFNLSNFQGCIFSGDFDGDGKCDVAVFAYVGVTVSIHCLEYNGATLTYSGIFWVGSASILDLNAAGWRVVSGDFDGNGKCDLAVLSFVTNATKVYALRGGSGSFTYNGLTWIGGSTIFDISIASGRIVTGDFNGDGKCDLSIFMYYGNAFTKMAVLNGTSSGFSYYLAWQHSSFDAGGITWCVVAGDFDGNGRDDIAAIMYYGNSLVKILVWRGTSTGMDYIGSVFEHSNFVGSLITGRVVAGDFNGDGKCDIATFYKYTNNTSLLAWQGTSTDFVYNGIIW